MQLVHSVKPIRTHLLLLPLPRTRVILVRRTRRQPKGVRRRLTVYARRVGMVRMGVRVHTVGKVTGVWEGMNMRVKRVRRPTQGVMKLRIVYVIQVRLEPTVVPVNRARRMTTVRVVPIARNVQNSHPHHQEVHL
jgi:hypothetical protein